MDKRIAVMGLIATLMGSLGGESARGDEVIGSVSTRFKILGPNDKKIGRASCRERVLRLV